MALKSGQIKISSQLVFLSLIPPLLPEVLKTFLLLLYSVVPM